MEAIVELICQYVAIWAPAVVAVVGLVAAILPALTKCKEALIQFKEDESVKDLVKQIQKQSAENEELVRCNKLLLEEITKIKNYADEIKKER